MRVVDLPGIGLQVGRPGTGRGAWLCRGSEACFDAAVRRRAFSRALRTTVPVEGLDRLRQLLLGPGAAGPGAPQVCEDGMSGRGTGPTRYEEEGS